MPDAPDDKMQRVTIYLTAAQRRKLRVRAAELGVKMSELVGRWLDDTLIEDKLFITGAKKNGGK